MITIAIDGPSGSGKSTVAKRLASMLNICHVNTGELYRSVAVYMKENNISAKDEEAVKKAMDQFNFKVDYINGEQYNFLNGECINHKLHTAEISELSAVYSPIAYVREKVKLIQRQIAKNFSVVMEGRNITTDILPNAKNKFYLSASPETRALRRQKELEEKGEKCTFKQVYNDILERDYRDTHRELGKLELAKDAVYINTDNYSVDEVVAIIYSKL